jgi:hypothetical protein
MKAYVECKGQYKLGMLRAGQIELEVRGVKGRYVQSDVCSGQAWR